MSEPQWNEGPYNRWRRLDEKTIEMELAPVAGRATQTTKFDAEDLMLLSSYRWELSADDYAVTWMGKGKRRRRVEMGSLIMQYHK